MSAKVGLLAHNQPHSAKPSTFIPKATAELMASLLAVEKLSQRLYRMFSPDSTYQVLNPHQVLPKNSKYIPAKLPPAEVGGCHFKPPVSKSETHVLRLMHIRRQPIIEPMPVAVTEAEIAHWREAFA